MATLGEKLAQIREGAKKRLSEDIRATMARGTQALRDSGALERVIRVGATLPPFALRNSGGETVRSETLLAQGPLVITVFRGSW